MILVDLALEPIQGPIIVSYCGMGHDSDNKNEVFVGIVYTYEDTIFTVKSESITVADYSNLTTEEFMKILGTALHLFNIEANKFL